MSDTTDIEYIGPDSKHLLKVYQDDDDDGDHQWGDMRWHVAGDLRAPGTGWSDEANYDCCDEMQPKFPGIDFDPESSCFYAYAQDRHQACELADAILLWVTARRIKRSAS